jgi:hypothetical protein
VKLPNTLIFDYPTVSAISAFAAAQVGATTAQGAGLAGAEMSSWADGKIETTHEKNTMELRVKCLKIDHLI